MLVSLKILNNVEHNRSYCTAPNSSYTGTPIPCMGPNTKVPCRVVTGPEIQTSKGSNQRKSQSQMLVKPQETWNSITNTDKINWEVNLQMVKEVEKTVDQSKTEEVWVNVLKMYTVIAIIILLFGVKLYYFITYKRRTGHSNNVFESIPFCQQKCHLVGIFF